MGWAQAGKSRRIMSSSGWVRALAACSGAAGTGRDRSMGAGWAGAWAAASKPSAKARRLASTPRPARRTVASKSSREKGRAPLPATAPNRLALMTLPARSARSCRSKHMKRLAAARPASSTLFGSAMPLPGADFSLTA